MKKKVLLVAILFLIPWVLLFYLSKYANFVYQPVVYQKPAIMELPDLPAVPQGQTKVSSELVPAKLPFSPKAEIDRENSELLLLKLPFVKKSVEIPSSNKFGIIERLDSGINIPTAEDPKVTVSQPKEAPRVKSKSKCVTIYGLPY